MLISGMAAGRRGKRISAAVVSAAASVSRQVSTAAGRPFSRPAYFRHDVVKGPAFRWASTSAFPPPGAIRAPIAQVTHLSTEEMEKDTYVSGSQFMREAELFEAMNNNPLLKGKVPETLVKLKALRTFLISALGVSYENHIRGISVGISFNEDNIEASLTYEEIRLKEAWGYRLDPAQGITLDSTYHALAETIDNMVRKAYPDIQYPRCFYGLLWRMKGFEFFFDEKTPPLDAETELHLLHNVSLFSVDDYIRFMTEMETLLRWKLPLYQANPTVRLLLNTIYSKVALLTGYDRLLWLQSIDKHKFLELCYDFSEEARTARGQPISDAEMRMWDSLCKGPLARKSTGGLAAAIKGPYMVFDPRNFQVLAVRQISIHRAVTFHLYQEILKDAEIQACFPYSVEDMGAAVRAILPLTASVIQSVLFKHGWFVETGMTKYRSVSPYSLRHGKISLSAPQ